MKPRVGGSIAALAGRRWQEGVRQGLQGPQLHEPPAWALAGGLRPSQVLLWA